MGQGGVGPEQQEQVGEAGDRRAPVGLRTVLGPGVAQRASVAAAQPVGDRDVHDPEPGAVDDHVDLVEHPVTVHDALGADLGDAGRDQLDVVLRERRVVVVAEQDPLAAEGPVGREPGPQGRIGDRAVQVPGRLPLGQRAQPTAAGEGQQAELVEPVDAVAGGVLQGRPAAVELLALVGDGPVQARHDPRWCALEQHQRGGLLLHDGDELDRARAGADHRDPLAGEVHVVVPTGAVEGRPVKGPHTRHLRVMRFDQPAAAADDDVRRELAPAGRQAPQHGRVVPDPRLEVGVEVEVGADPEVGGDPLQVGADLGLPAEDVRPVRVRREGEGVQVARHVAGAAGVGVVAPGAPDGGRPLEHHEVLDALLPQPDRGADAREAAADDRHAHVGGQGRRGRHVARVRRGRRPAPDTNRPGQGRGRRRSSRPRKRCRKRS